jgi:hypothetical protein
MIAKKRGVTIDCQRESLRAANARGAQHGCNGPSRRRGNKPGTCKQRHKLSYVIFVVRGDGRVRKCRDPAAVRRNGQLR